MRTRIEPTIYAGTFIHNDTPTTVKFQQSTAIGVDETGKIAFIEGYKDLDKEISQIAAKNNFKSYKLVECPSVAKPAKTNAGSGRPRKLKSFFFPGFIDTHTHASQYPNTGIFGSSTLLDWLNTYTFPLESSFRDLKVAKRIYTRAVSRSVSNGTTCAAYYGTVHVPATNLLADICLEKGQRALVGRVCMDRMSPEDYRDESAESAIRDTEACIAHAEEIDPRGETVRPVITPRFAPSCTDKCLSGLGQLHKRSGHFVQTHISENVREINLVREVFPDAENYASVYDKAGLLSDRTILAHAVHLSDEEISLIQTRGAKISHCPLSNSCLTSGAARVKMLREKGIDVALGTDMSGGYSPSILEIVRQTLLVSRHVAMVDGDESKLSIAEALWFGTRGGAKVVGLEDRVGAFEVGMDWDAQMICLRNIDDDYEDDEDPGLEDYGPVDIFGLENWDDILAKWVYIGDDRNVAAVWVGGRCVHDRRGLYSST